MSSKQDPELFLRPWLDPFDFFPQHLQPQPLILGCRQVVACNRERVCCVSEFVRDRVCTDPGRQGLHSAR